jgi:hypothetical protein
MRRPRIVEEEVRDGRTVFVVYDGEEDEKKLGWSYRYQDALELILVPYRDGPKKKTQIRRR